MLKKSNINGEGIFLEEDIKKDTIVWEFNLDLVSLYTQDQYNSSSYELKRTLDTYSYFSKKLGMYILPEDITRYLNHSCTPNLYFQNEFTARAIRDIKKDEELTECYCECSKKDREDTLKFTKYEKDYNFLCFTFWEVLEDYRFLFNN